MEKSNAYTIIALLFWICGALQTTALAHNMFMAGGNVYIIIAIGYSIMKMIRK